MSSLLPASSTTTTQNDAATPTATSPSISRTRSHKSTPEKEDLSPSRSFLSRFGVSLRPRKCESKVAEFSIEPAEPYRKYAAGDHVLGAVILAITKPLAITHLTVSLHGFIRVFKGPVAANEVAGFNAAEIPSKTFKYYGNGHASLFQDEQVLAADGKLDSGRYIFNFDLVFPEKGLPSSIDFERGTISYMITATLTRPTSSQSITSCDRKVYFIRHVDIGRLAPPRARTIYLEPISKRSKRRKHLSTEKQAAPGQSDAPGSSSDPDMNGITENSTEGSFSVYGDDNRDGQESNSNSRSPIHSDVRSISSDSAISGSTGFQTVGGEPVNTGSVGGSQAGNRASVEERTITATIAPQKGACLPGEMIPVKISVQHIKPVKSMHGVIVTLYRQGRVDSAPPISLFKDLLQEEVKRLEKEELYPKSKTGLGGLSLSSAGSCSMFRKDLSQTFSPLIVDPEKLTATVATSVRMPEDSFPTLAGVQGEMISFKYQLEIILDLGGKLANQIQGGNSSSSRPGGPMLIRGFGNSSDGTSASTPFYGTSIIDTDWFRREKGVVSCHFEIVVGTSDSSRTRSRAVYRPPTTMSHALNPIPQDRPEDYNDDLAQDDCSSNANGGPRDNYAGRNAMGPAAETYWDPGDDRPAAPYYVPTPDMVDEMNLGEKERVRCALQRLLPSRPADGPTGPSFLADPGRDHVADAEDRPSAPGPSHLVCYVEQETLITSAPSLHDYAVGARSGAFSHDDKQELERLRLLVEASAPPEFPEDCDSGGSRSGAAGPSSSATAPAFAPSAPVLNEEDEYGYPGYAFAGSSSSAEGVEQLPRYER